MSSTGSTVFVATSRGLYRAGTGEPVAFAGKHVRGITGLGDTLLAIVGRHEVWGRPMAKPVAAAAAARGRTHDGWRLIARLDEQLWSLHRAGETLWIGSEGAHLYRLPWAAVEAQLNGDGAEPRLVASFESYDDRERWYTPWGGPPAVRSMTSTDDGTLFVNVHVGGIHRSYDGGESWEQTIDIGIDVHEVLATAGSSPVVLASAGKGFAESRDRGESWRVTTDGLEFTYMRAVTVAGDTLLVSASNGPHGDRGAVYTRPLESEQPFKRLTRGLPDWFEGNVDTFCLRSAKEDGTAGGAASGQTGSRGGGAAAGHTSSRTGEAVAVGAPGGAVYVSTDAGASWEEVASGLPEINALVWADG